MFPPLFSLRSCTTCLLLAVFASASLGQSTPVASDNEDPGQEGTCGIKPLGKPDSTDRYHEQWALIIGIDYKDRPPINGQFKELRNAERDAQAVRDILVNHYGYKPANIKLLLGPNATRENIHSSLGGDFLGSKSKVQENDSVLVFFAGHGHRIPWSGGQIGVISPFDVRKQEQSNDPDYSSVLSYNHEVIPLLQSCPARHKLLVLNCCHAGEVFANPLGAFPQSLVDSRNGGALFRASAFQALASSRANEVDSDGSPDEVNSPFTASLLYAFKTLPNRSTPFFTVTDLFTRIGGDFAQRRRDEQSPSLRSLIAEDGEFRFYPDQKTNFDQYRERGISIELLRAMVPGEYGNWWFDEAPWFIPSLRMEILANRKEDVKRGVYVDAIRRDALIEAAKSIRDKLKNSPTDDLLSQLRFAQLETLLRSERNKDYRSLREELIEKLSKREDLLQATDLHLLAVLQHSLGRKEAENSYEHALRKYVAERTGISDSGEKRKIANLSDNKALHALCLADYGFYKFDEMNECELAATYFSEARELFNPLEAPPPFEIFLLCRDADALQRLGRWGLALKRLDQALCSSARIDPEQTSSLTAHTLNRKGWALMEQWRFKKAQDEFERSEAILLRLTKEDPNALILSFHNRHGLAMAERFQGQAGEAAKKYRELVNDVAKWFTDTRESAATKLSTSEIQERLRERWFNSMERLVDCNLFADPGERDLREAADDLRRALRSCYVMSGSDRYVIEAGLLYKQAIVLSLKSPAQDIPLALSCCKRAETLLAGPLLGNKRGLLDFQHKLARPIVDLFKVCADEPVCLESKRAALAKLRAAVEELREKWKSNDHRDYLEFLMFACRILVDEAIDTDRYETLTDAEMLLGFCRRTLKGGSGESLRYLRPYYDTVMEAKLRLKPKHVKELLEVQWEATRGTSYRKNNELVPVIAVYHLKDKPYLLLDIPGGASNYYALQDDYSRDEMRKALLAGSDPLELPREVVRELQKIPSPMAGNRDLDCWLDSGPVASSVHTTGLRGYPQQQFPFKIPRGFAIMPPGLGAPVRLIQNK